MWKSADIIHVVYSCIIIIINILGIEILILNLIEFNLLIGTYVTYIYIAKNIKYIKYDKKIK